MGPPGRRLGFVDYELDNWHAHTYLKLLRGELAARGYIVAGCTAMRRRTGRRWAAANAVPWFDSPAAMDGGVDGYVVLAPSRAECHLQLCQAMLPLGKPTFVDKTFAPDAATGRAIFRLADRHGTPIESCSALRYTAVQARAAELGGPMALRHMTVFAPGQRFDEYVVHPLEMVVSCMGAGARRLMRRGAGRLSQLLIDYGGGRAATVNLCLRTDTPYAAALTTADRTELVTVDLKCLFADAATGMLTLFETGRPSIARAETLTILRLIDAARRPRALKGFIPV